MPTYLHPGVYVEEIPSGVKPIEGVGTSTAIFIGFANKGTVGEPVAIGKWDDYARLYGGHRDTGADTKGDPMAYAVAAFFQNGGTQAYIARLAVAASGKPLAKAAGWQLMPGDSSKALLFTALDEGEWANGLVVQITAKTAPGMYLVEVGRPNGKGVFVAQESFNDVSFSSVSPRYVESVINGFSELLGVAVKAAADVSSVAVPASYSVGTSISGAIGSANLNFTGVAADADRTLSITVDGGTAVAVVLPKQDYTGDLSTLAAYIQSKVREGAAADSARAKFTATVNTKDGKLVLQSNTGVDASEVEVTGAAAVECKLGAANGGVEKTGSENKAARDASGPVELSGGGDGTLPDSAAYDALFTKLVKHRDVNIVCLPGQEWKGAGKSIIEKAIAHAEQMRDRMVIVDPPSDVTLNTEDSVNGLSLSTSTYAVTYYPWIQVVNVYYNAETNPGAPDTVLVPPAGYAAGMWAKIDGRRGVWKAPAGVETGLLGVASLNAKVDDGDQDALNPLGVNCIRSLPGFGPVIWGARTLSTKANPEWRYVPVRRTAIFIERSIYDGIQWAVFEGNDHLLWSSLRANIASFMDGLFRGGAFQGEKASDAYFVRCGLGDTMTQDDIDRGQVIVIVGFAPLKPAEFVIIRLQQKVNKQ